MLLLSLLMSLRCHDVLTKVAAFFMTSGADYFNSLTLSNVSELSWSWSPKSEQYSSSKKERNIRHRLFTFSIKREIRQFHVVIVQWRQKNLPKSVLRLQSCCCFFSNLIKLLFWCYRCQCFLNILSSLFLPLSIFFITIHRIIHYLCIVVCVTR